MERRVYQATRNHCCRSVLYFFSFHLLLFLLTTHYGELTCTRNKLFTLFRFLSPTFVSECRCHYKIIFVIQGRDFCLWWGYINRSRSVSLRITKRVCSWSICSFGESPWGTICHLFRKKRIMCSFCIIFWVRAASELHAHGEGLLRSNHTRSNSSVNHVNQFEKVIYQFGSE